MADTDIEARLQTILVSPATTVTGALARIDESGEGILMVVDAGRRLLGVVTDGDARRWILSGRSLDEPVERVMNMSPIVLEEGADPNAARERMVAHRIGCVPVVSADGVVVSAVWWLDLFEAGPPKHRIDVPVVIMAGGEGSRLSPFTKVLPKPLVPVGDKPIVEVIMERFADHGADRFFMSVNYKAALIKAYFADVRHSFELGWLEEDRPLGTAGSLHLLEGRVDSTFFVSNCDILIDADYGDVLRAHRDSGNALTLVASVKQYAIPYGVCELDEGSGMLGAMIEKPEYNLLVSTGMFVLEPELLQHVPTDRVYHMTDLINDRAAAGEKMGVYPVSDKAWLDMGQWETYREMLARLS